MIFISFLERAVTAKELKHSPFGDNNYWQKNN